ncbi:unnamed protein product [Musa textilis]
MDQGAGSNRSLDLPMWMIPIVVGFLFLFVLLLSFCCFSLFYYLNYLAAVICCSLIKMSPSAASIGFSPFFRFCVMMDILYKR